MALLLSKSFLNKIKNYNLFIVASYGKIIPKKIIDIPRPRPRDRAGSDFMQIKAEIVKEFHLGTEYPFAYAI